MEMSPRATGLAGTVFQPNLIFRQSLGKVNRPRPPSVRVGVGVGEKRPTVRYSARPGASSIEILRGEPTAGARGAGAPFPHSAGYIQMSDVESPLGKRISWARAGPVGSLPKSTKKSSLSRSPPLSVSQSTCKRYEPCSFMSG